MIDEKLKARIDGAISENKGLATHLEILRGYKLNGGTQSDALETMQSMRDAPEDYEDRILEIMDFASGFCRPENKVWP